MSDGIPYADLIILALITGFILLRLRSVLGQRDDDGFFNREQTRSAQPPEPVIQLDEKSMKPKLRIEPDPYALSLPEGAVLAAINDIKSKDPQFSATGFLNGAKLAYEMVHDAFTRGDKPTLKMLLSDGIYQDFSGEIDKRASEDHRAETTLVSVNAKSMTHVTVEKNMARIGVHFVSEQVILVRDKAGNITEGNASDLHHVENDWTFERDVTSKNPNWKIIET